MWNLVSFPSDIKNIIFGGERGGQEHLHSASATYNIAQSDLNLILFILKERLAIISAVFWFFCLLTH